jgi:hypothetical protein
LLERLLAIALGGAQTGDRGFDVRYEHAQARANRVDSVPLVHEPLDAGRISAGGLAKFEPGELSRLRIRGLAELEAREATTRTSR